MRLGRIQNDYTASGFAKTKEQGLEFIEICCNNAEEAAALVAAKEEVKRLIRQTGIDVSCVGRWNHDILKDGVIDAEKKLGYFALLDTAVELGAKTFVCGVNYDKTISLLGNYQNAVAFLGELCERARGTGVKVAVQNCHWNNFIVSPEQWRVILEELPDLYLKFDASHAYHRGDDYLAELSDWCHRVAHVHIKGTTIAGSQKVADPPAGMDDIQWRSLFAILYARGYNGDLSIEPHSSVWKNEMEDRGIAFTQKFIREFLV